MPLFQKLTDTGTAWDTWAGRDTAGRRAKRKMARADLHQLTAQLQTLHGINTKRQVDVNAALVVLSALAADERRARPEEPTSHTVSGSDPGLAGATSSKSHWTRRLIGRLGRRAWLW